MTVGSPVQTGRVLPLSSAGVRRRFVVRKTKSQSVTVRKSERLGFDLSTEVKVPSHGERHLPYTFSKESRDILGKESLKSTNPNSDFF